MNKRSVFLSLLLSIPICLFGQTTDSLFAVKQIDSLLRRLRPLIEQQKLEEALETVQQAQQKTATTFGEGHVAFATCLAYRGKIAQKQEKYKEAESWYLKAMVLQERHYGKESPQYVISMSTLSTIYLMMGEYVKAEPLILETLSIRQKLVGQKHPDYARTLGTLGSLHYHKGNFGKAELLYLEAMAIFEKTVGKRHPEYVFVLANLTNVYVETGNYAKAEPLMLEVTEINEAAHGKQHPFYVKALANLATLYSRMGNMSKSISLDLEIIELFNNGLSKENPDYAMVLVNLAGIYLDQGEYEKAAPLVLEAEQVSAKIYGKQHPDYGRALIHLGQFYAAEGDYTKAESIFLQSHSINIKNLEPDHPYRARTAGLLAQLYQETNRIEESSLRFLESEQLNRRLIEKASGYSSEAEMSNYLQKFQQNTAQFYSFAQVHASPAITAACFDNALFYKGFLLNASIQVKNRACSEADPSQKFGFLRAYRHRLTEEYSKPVAERDSAILAEFEDKATALEKELARTVVGYSDALRQVNWQEVQAALKPGEAAVEFIHFQQFNAKGKPTDSIQYAALVLRPGDSAPGIISLFEEQELIPILQGASGGNYRKINGLYSAGNASQKSLYDLIWKKLEASLQGVKKVYCSYAGLLHRLNLGAIPLSPGETFTDRRQLVVLGSTRQLVIAPPAAPVSNEALLIGGVNYAENSVSNSTVEAASSPSRGISELESPLFEADSLVRGDSWNFLPATVTEVLNLRRLLQSARVMVKLDTGYAASEESIKLAGDPNAPLTPRVLHFATHGYFFPDPRTSPGKAPKPTEIAFKTAQNPLLRSGLILAGAQQVWSSGKAPPGREDGVLTAQEIGLLNLSGTELVVLSACETGLGDIDGNEGVYGLQRAFKIAGAKYILMSLWKVNDQTTSEFMTEFYTQWLKKGLDLPKAFQNAQHAMKAKYQEAYHWAGFILVE